MRHKTADARFLALLSDDIKRRPEAIMPMPERAAARMRELAEEVGDNLDDEK